MEVVDSDLENFIQMSIQKKIFIKEHKSLTINLFQPTIKIPEKIFIPNEYIGDLDVKMSIYKRISLIKNNQENNNLIIELIDRFGQFPNEVENLFKLIKIKILCLKNNIEQIEFGKKGILFSFYKKVISINVVTLFVIMNKFYLFKKALQDKNLTLFIKLQF